MTQDRPDPTIEPFRIGKWLVEPRLDQLSSASGTVKVEPRTMRLLTRLARSQGDVVETQTLLDEVWSGVVVGPASVYQAMSQLRKVLEDTDSPASYIATVPRRGYRLVAKVEPAVQAAPPHVVDATVANSRPARYWQLAAIAILLVSVTAATWWLLAPGREDVFAAGASATAHSNSCPLPPVDPARPALAVLPFESGNTAGSAELASSVEFLLRARLAEVATIKVTAPYSAFRAAQPPFDAERAAGQLHVRYLLRGRITRVGNTLRLDVSLLDMTRDTPLWKRAFDRALVEFVPLREEITRLTLEAMGVAFVLPHSTAPANFDAVALYKKGVNELASGTPAARATARATFERSVALDPDLALSHVGIGRALLTAGQPGAEKAFERALEKDPRLGEAWLALAQLNQRDLAKAEPLYCKGLQLAPNDVEGLSNFAMLLSGTRWAEAMQLIDRARVLEPLAARFHADKAILLAVPGLRDEAAEEEWERLMKQALSLEPDYAYALMGVGFARSFRGDLAEAIGYLERALKAAPDMDWLAYALVQNYLAVDDPDAASSAAARGKSTTGRISVHLYRREFAQAAALARPLIESGNPLPQIGVEWIAYAIRDDALDRGEYTQALGLLDSMYARVEKDMIPHLRPSVGFAYAHVMLLAGEKERGTALAKRLMLDCDVLNPDAREGTAVTFCGLSTYALLGDDERAVAELRTNAVSRALVMWWYAAREPAFDHLRGHPSVRATFDAARRSRLRQRSLLDEMRRKGEVPRREAPQ